MITWKCRAFFFASIPVCLCQLIRSIPEGASQIRWMQHDGHCSRCLAAVTILVNYSIWYGMSGTHFPDAIFAPAKDHNSPKIVPAALYVAWCSDHHDFGCLIHLRALTKSQFEHKRMGRRGVGMIMKDDGICSWLFAGLLSDLSHCFKIIRERLHPISIS